MTRAPAGRPPVRIVEVGPRDGLQNEKAPISVEAKVRFVEALAATGLREIEAGAFVSPKAVPQMADSEAVFEAVTRKRGVVYSALVPNETGLDRALEAGADKVAVFTAASETFNKRNINASIAESIDRFRPVVARAKAAKLPVRAYISTAFHCPYEGKIAPESAVAAADRLLALGVDELSIGDTIGKAVPDEVRRLLERLLKKTPTERVFLHFHDTYGTAVANALAAWTEFGVSGFDSSAGGLGGCPYAPGATGNVATEDLLFAFAASGAKVPAEAGRVAAAAAEALKLLGRPAASHLGRVGAAQEVAR
ncbi:MAG TPA: hydroxymethylglutaryl-CoA lyase [Elusimicrobiota bacterium]|jgi:hydroxymethylglutaryl-CoA lyase|nr:hydroxymethylglutaryl-CoA lyase [Elusimicrobiota bacterium]